MMYISKTDEYYYVFMGVNKSILHLEQLSGNKFFIDANNKKVFMFCYFCGWFFCKLFRCFLNYRNFA